MSGGFKFFDDESCVYVPVVCFVWSNVNVPLVHGWKCYVSPCRGIHST